MNMTSIYKVKFMVFVVIIWKELVRAVLILSTFVTYPIACHLFIEEHFVGRMVVLKNWLRGNMGH